MWYVIDCGEDACLYYGFKAPVGKEEFARRIRDNTLPDILNRVPIRRGDCFYIEAGTIHAIGKNTLIAEIQQNSNVTYRVCDYGRTDSAGNTRPLHIEKALDVTKREMPRPTTSGRTSRKATALSSTSLTSQRSRRILPARIPFTFSCSCPGRER